MLNAYDILINLMDIKTQREKLIKGNYLKRVYKYVVTLLDEMESGQFDLCVSPTKIERGEASSPEKSSEDESSQQSPKTPSL